jgi:hypothetical protein
LPSQVRRRPNPPIYPVSVDKSFLGAGSDETSSWNPYFAGFPVFNLCPRYGNDWGADAPIALAPLGIGPGDTIRLIASGSFKAGRSGLLFSGDSNQAVLSHQIGLFSASSAITPCVGFSASSCANLNGSPTSTPRVASAIDAGVDHITGVMGLSEAASFNTDIAQDFYIPTTGVDVVVPAGENYLWVAPWDNVKSTGPYGHLYYGNQTNGGFGVSVEQLTPPVDTDGDGTFDDEDNCPALANAGQEDLDADGVGDVCDNCPDEANADQADADADGIDNDNDGFADHDGAGLGDPDPQCAGKPWRDNEGPDRACGPASKWRRCWWESRRCGAAGVASSGIRGA